MNTYLATNFNHVLKRVAIATLLTVGFFTFQTTLAETAIWDGTMVRPTEGSGTEDDPYLINTAEEMAYLIRNYDYNDGICYRKYYKLTRDLDMRSTQWTFGSATSDNKSFRAHFNGAGHKISNIEVSLQDSQGECHYGLFPQMGGDKDFEAVIENLEVENIHFVRSTGDPTGTYNFRIGGLVGKMYSNSRVSNCLVRGFEVSDYGIQINLHSASKISACPLVGEIMDFFGDSREFDVESRVLIEHSYGHGTADLTHFHGHPEQFYTTEVQGKIQKEGFTQNNYTWHMINETDRSFSMMGVNVTQTVGKQFQYEGTFERFRGHTYSYMWMLDGVRLGNSRTATVTVEPKPYKQRLSLTVFDIGMEAGGGAVLIEPDQFSLAIENLGKSRKSGYRGKLTSLNGIAFDENDFDFEWQDLTDNERVVSNSVTLNNPHEGHTYLLLATHRKNRGARFSCIKSLAKPIYVCNRGISKIEVEQYTNDGQIYKKGDDKNDGLTPATAVRTLKRAYQLLASAEKGGSVGKNVIVIMGDYGDYDFTEYLDSHCKNPNPSYFPKNKPALITGRYDNFKNGRLLFAGLSIRFDADTRFEEINLSGASFEVSDIPNQTKVFAWGNNLTMGYGIFISGYKIMDYTLGLEDGVLAPAITLYGGILNNNDPTYVHKENTLTIHSGTYGRVIAGDGYTLQMPNTGNISGNPSNPVRTRVVCDVTNHYNPFHTQYDVALVIGGQADGTVYADTHIDIKGNSKIGRIVGGNVAFGRVVPGRPADSFFGRTNVTVSGGTVTEIYGTNLGRYGHILYASETEHDSCVTYFYGKTYLNLIGGTITNTVYGGGAACVTGFDYDGKHHTEDPHVPYLKGDRVVFGRYSEAVGKMPIMQLSNGEKLDLSKTELHVSIGGNIHMMGSVYGGSVSFSSLLPTHQAGSQSGCIFANTYINMTGGLVDGYLFGGCRSNLSYFDNSDHSNYPLVNGVQTDKMFFTNMAMMYGNAYVTVNGGEVRGVIFGGGEGPYYRQVSEDDRTNAVAMLGSLFGNTQVNIGGNVIVRDYIFGGGNYSNVYRTGNEKDPMSAGNVTINVSGGELYGAVLGGGNGDKDTTKYAYVRSIYPKVAGDVRITLSGGRFVYNSRRPHYIKKRIYGIAAGGMETCIVRGNTYLTIESNPFDDLLRLNENVNAENDLILCAGGYLKEATVVGQANLTLNSKNAPKIDRLYAGGIYGPVGSTNTKIVSGSAERVHSTGRFGTINSGKVAITVGTPNDDFGLNYTIRIDNLFGGYDLSKTDLKLQGGNVLNILRAE